MSILTRSLGEGELRKLAEWRDAHLAEHHGGVEPYGGAIGGRLTFEITETSIGEMVAVRCNACRDKARNVSHCDLTDFEAL